MIACPIANFCIEDVRSLLSNYTSETPDKAVRVGYWSFYDFPRLRGNPEDPTQNFSALGCIGFCESPISQEDADLCAARQATICDNGNNNRTTDPPGPNATLYYSYIFGFTAQCPGSPSQTFTFFVPAGTFIASSQEQANAMAQSYAARVARMHLICLSDLTPEACCANSFGLFTGYARTAFPISEWKATGVPPGMTFSTEPDPLNRRFKISGVPTTIGQYSVTVTAKEPGGGVMSRTYIIDVAGFTNCNDPLPDAKCDQPYSFTFATSGLVAPLTFRPDPTVPLPFWATLDPDTGELYGTPTEDPTSHHIVVLVEDSRTTGDGFPIPLTCGCDTTLNVTGPRFRAPFPSDGTVCTPYSFQMTTTPPAATCTFSGSCPDGLSISASGLITGTPVSPGTGGFVITATDTDGNTNTWSGNVTIFPDGSGVPKAIKDIVFTPQTVTMPGGGSYSVTDLGGGQYQIHFENDGGVDWGYDCFSIQILGSLARCAATPSYTITLNASATFTTDAIGPNLGKCFYTVTFTTDAGSVVCGNQTGGWSDVGTAPAGIYPPVGTASDNVQMVVQCCSQMFNQQWKANLTVNFSLTPLVPP